MLQQTEGRRKDQEFLLLSGYDEVETPILEYFDVFAGIKTSIDQENMFKLIDPEGRILVLQAGHNHAYSKDGWNKTEGLCFADPVIIPWQCISIWRDPDMQAKRSSTGRNRASWC